MQRRYVRLVESQQPPLGQAPEGRGPWPFWWSPRQRGLPRAPRMQFWLGDQMVWLADYIPPAFIRGVQPAGSAVRAGSLRRPRQRRRRRGSRGALPTLVERQTAVSCRLTDRGFRWKVITMGPVAAVCRAARDEWQHRHHVEAHAAAIMRSVGLDDATLLYETITCGEPQWDHLLNVSCMVSRSMCGFLRDASGECGCL